MEQQVGAVNAVLPVGVFIGAMRSSIHRWNKDHSGGANVREALGIVTGTGRHALVPQAESVCRAGELILKAAVHRDRG